MTGQPLRIRLPISGLLMLLLTQLGCAQESGERTTLAIRLDGRIGAEEWDGAARYDLVGGGEVLLKRGTGGLYLAVRGEAFGWSHVYLSQGDTLFVLHASAALGTAAYERDTTDGWERAAPFEWAVRDTTLSPEAEATRAAFLAEHGWVANTNMMGTRRVIEFFIAEALLGEKELRLAALYASDPGDPQHWPGTLRDATLDSHLIAGRAPERLDFDPTTWAAPVAPR